MSSSVCLEQRSVALLKKINSLSQFLLLCGKASEQLSNRIRQLSVFQDRNRLLDSLDEPGRNAHDSCSRRNRFDDDRASTYARAIPHCNVTQQDSPGTYDYSIFNRGMPLFFLQRGASQNNALVHEHFVAYLGRLAYDYAHAVVDKESSSYLRTWVNLDSRERTTDMRKEPSQEK